jgi:ATP-dependent Clp protease adaptor protein ClpS
MTQTQERTILDEDVEVDFTLDDLWAVLVWNDDVNTFDHVIESLVAIFGHTEARAEELAWQVHRSGKAVVAIRPKDEAVAGVAELHRRKIQASIDRA